VVDASERADIRVRLLSPDPVSVAVVVETRTGSRERLVVVAQLPEEQVHLSVIHVTLALVHEALAELRHSAAAPIATGPEQSSAPLKTEPSPAPRISTQDARLPAPAASQTWQMGATANTAALWSGATAGSLVSAGAFVRRGVIDLDLTLAVHVPFGIPSELHVIETGALLGGRMRQQVTSWLLGAVGLDAGVWLQHYRYRDTSGFADDGNKFDPVLIPRVGMYAIVAPWLQLGVESGAVLTLHERVHQTATTTLSRAPRARWFFGASIAFLRLLERYVISSVLQVCESDAGTTEEAIQH
jgi:hypothetical protein